MAENFLKQNIVQKSHRVPNKINQNKPTLRYSIIKMAGVRNKEKILKATREITESHKGKSHKAIC